MGADAAPTPTLSVVIACRDAVDVLAGQLAALSGQACPVPWEVLVCDNGSTDGSPQLAERWADRLPLRVVDASGVPGAGPARNAGARAARGRWLAFCDADDQVGEGWLAAVCGAMTGHTFAAGRFEYRRLNSPRVRRSRTPDQQDGLQRSSSVVPLPHAGGGNLAVRRDAFLAVGGFDPSVRYLQDTELCWRLQRAGHELVFVPDMVVHVRLRSTWRGMYRQGRHYGTSLARLEQRYGGEVPPSGAASSPPEPVAAPPEPAAAAPEPAAAAPEPAAAQPGAHGRMARWVRWVLANRPTVGALAWQVGWHHGRHDVLRSGTAPAQRSAPTTPPSLTPPGHPG